MRRFIDIGANITDSMFRGVYHGSNKHGDDFQQMLERARSIGMKKIIITGGNLKDSKTALELASTSEDLFCTVGCHPTRCSEFESSPTYLDDLIALAKSSDKVVAVGEFGLDYDRLKFCSVQVQKKYFEEQFQLVDAVPRKPLFLHCRNASNDFMEIIKRNRDRFQTGVVHSFDGSLQDARQYLDLNLYIGINGCSLKTEENIQVVKEIPVERLMIETDCPYCDIRPTHASFRFVKTVFDSKKKEKFEEGKQVKGRNEPQNIIQVLEAIAGIKDCSVDELADTIFETTENVFFS